MLATLRLFSVFLLSFIHLIAYAACPELACRHTPNTKSPPCKNRSTNGTTPTTAKAAH